MKKKLRITVKGQTYDVIAEILDDEIATPVRSASISSTSASADVAPAAPAPKAPAPVASAAGDIPSPIAGTVVSVAKLAGNEVAEGEVLMVLEAMKMNTEIISPGAGKVTAVHVTAGQSIEEGQLLMTIA